MLYMYIQMAARMLLVHVFLSSIMAISSSSSSTFSGNISTAILVRVDQSGEGDYTNIQDAIDSVPSNNSRLIFILIKPGKYNERIIIPAHKRFVTLSGTNASNTVITGNEGGNLLQDSPTMTILASDFIARYLTIQNTYGKTGKGVALKVSGDRTAFYDCRILSYQDTLLDDIGRHYYKNCYIEGATDFIFGNAASLYEKCHIHSISKGNGAITAQKRESSSENTGFIFLQCKITGTGGAVLGRPWGSYSRVVYAMTYMSSVIQPEGWNDWGDPSKQKTVYYGEYKCFGPGAKRDQRVKWSRSLSENEAAPFLEKRMIGGQEWIKPSPVYFKKNQQQLP